MNNTLKQEFSPNPCVSIEKSDDTINFLGIIQFDYFRPKFNYWDSNYVEAFRKQILDPENEVYAIKYHQAIIGVLLIQTDETNNKTFEMYITEHSRRKKMGSNIIYLIKKIFPGIKAKKLNYYNPAINKLKEKFDI